MSSHGGRGEGALWGLSYKSTNPIHEGSAFMTLSPPKCLTSKYHHLRGRYFNIWILGGHRLSDHRGECEAEGGRLFFCFCFCFCFFILQVLISHPFYTHQCIHVNPNLPIHHTSTTPTFPALVSIRLFSTSVSQFLPCKLVHVYHFSRFHIYVLIYDICFSLSDLLHSV